LDARVILPDIHHQFKKAINKDNNFEIYLRVLDCRTELANESCPYGAVKSGYLTVCGRKREIVWHKYFQLDEALRDSKIVPGFFYKMIKSHRFKGIAEAFVELDCLEPNLWDPTGTYPPVSLLEFKDHAHGSQIECKGLVLRGIKDSSSWRRIGMFYLKTVRIKSPRFKKLVDISPNLRELDREQYIINVAEDKRQRSQHIAKIRASKNSWFSDCKREVVTII
jgi:hypothetical protein